MVKTFCVMSILVGLNGSIISEVSSIFSMSSAGVMSVLLLFIVSYFSSPEYQENIERKHCT
jgi:fucose permease